MKQLDQVAKRLETQADALEQQPKYGGYYRQQVRMRRMVIQEVKALQEKLQAVEMFNDLSVIKRPTIAKVHHGTTWSRAVEIERRIQANEFAPFRFSTGDGEWLGHGVYFWLMAPHRAALWGPSMYNIRRRFRPWLPNITDPTQSSYEPFTSSVNADPRQESHFAVIRTYVRLFPRTTLNLLDQNWLTKLQAFGNRFISSIGSRPREEQALIEHNWGFAVTPQGTRKLQPMLDGVYRNRDCFFFNAFLEENPELQAVIASVREGVQQFGLNLWSTDHAQVNVRDQSIIVVEDLKIEDAKKFGYDPTVPPPPP